MKKGEVILPRIETVERSELVKTQKKITDLLSLIQTSFNNSDKSQVNKTWLESLITGFHYPESLLSEKEIKAKMTFFELYDEFLRTHKLSDGRKTQFKVLRRMLQR
ncbi:MAG TPA: hypothetical protein PLP88_11675, partial [Bacteroidales bacterium]|nr:hypothetical protein [Bacteroidales bacterium]